MDQITLRVQSDVKSELAAEAKEDDKTLSEHMRDVISERNRDTEIAGKHEKLQADYDRLRKDHDRLQQEFERIESENERLQSELERLQGETEQLREENERLDREKRMILQQREEKQQLVEYVETERAIAERKEHAHLLKRAKWWLTGVPTESE